MDAELVDDARLDGVLAAPVAEQCQAISGGHRTRKSRLRMYGRGS